MHTAQDPTFDDCNDWEQCNQLFERQLMHRGDVVYFRRFSASGKEGMIICCPARAAQILRKNGGDYACMDSKHDTTKGKTFFTTMRVLGNQGSCCVGGCIGVREDETTIKILLESLEKNTPCPRIDCTHDVVTHWSECRQVFWTERVCAKEFPVRNRYVGHDKHVPSFNAVRSSGWGTSLLDPWHVHKAFVKYMVEKVKTTLCINVCIHVFTYI
jgi:hypothetical protein